MFNKKTGVRVDSPEVLAIVNARKGLPLIGSTDGDPYLIYSYHVECEGKKEIRNINEYHMNLSYGGQTELEEFLQKRCSKVEFLGNCRTVEHKHAIYCLSDEPEAVDLSHKVDFLQKQGAEISGFFEEGTSWLDELRKCHQ